MTGIHEQLDAGRVVPTYPTPEEAVRALAAATRYGAWRRRDPGPRVDPPGRDPAAAQALVELVLAANPEGVELSAEQAATLLGHYGVQLWPTVPVASSEEAVGAAERLGYPVALKTNAPHLRHRIDLGGVRLDIGDAEELAEDVSRMKQHPRPARRCRPRRPGDGAHRCGLRRPVRRGPALRARRVVRPRRRRQRAARRRTRTGSRRSPRSTWPTSSARSRPRRSSSGTAARRRRTSTRSTTSSPGSPASPTTCPRSPSSSSTPSSLPSHGAAVLGATIRLAPDAGRTDAGVRELTVG